MGNAFNPWAALRDRADVELVWELLPDGLDGLYCPASDGSAVIVLDATLTRTRRRAVLCHELIHAERGISGDARTDERGVDDEVARRLVPVDELLAMKEIAELNDLPVEVWMVAARFDVPDSVAERAMRLLLGGTK